MKGKILHTHSKTLPRHLCFSVPFIAATTGVLISPYPDKEGNKLGSISGTPAISTISRRELSSSFFFHARQDAEGNSRHSDRNI